MASGTAGSTAAGASTNLQEFYSPRPINNNGVGELKTSKSGDKDEKLQLFCYRGSGGETN